ncbi:MAG: Lrp/AsnC family transcriptional regulator [Nitrososphaerota archaeon]|nr:Lrp/AsnC family transcriptional regulator [Nitrososphaerota archaeon]
MARSKPSHATKDETPDLEARIIAAIGKAGPRNVAQISRMTGAHQETIRYKIKKRFGRLGFRFHAEVDFPKLGLNLHWATLSFSEAYHSLAPQILAALNRVGYLTYYGKIIPQGYYVALFALPEGTTGTYREFLSGLVTERILSSFTLEESVASRHKPMDPKYFNFRLGKWEIGWNRVAEQAPLPLAPEPKPQLEDFDHYDLLIIKELQKDSLQHLTTIARRLNVHQKTLEYHYRTHVQKWKLVPSYRIQWVQDASKRLAHATATTWLAFRNLSESDLADVQAAISKIPFLWSEDVLEGGAYIVTMYTPLTDLLAVSAYVNSALPRLASKVEIGFVSPADSYLFNVPHNMYQDGEWKLNTQQIGAALRKESAAPLQN